MIVAAALIAGLAYLVPGGFVRGLTVGVLGTAVVAMLFVLVLEVTGTAATRMGGTAEQWTASELRPLRRSGWRLINHYLLKGEIDHLLIGPAGVIVVETKWSRSAWRLDPPDHHAQEALTQVKKAVHQVELWGEVRRAGCWVRPVLFLWSAERSGRSREESTVAFVDGVTVIEGRRTSAAWRERVEAADRQLSSEAVEALARVAMDHLADRDQYEAARQTAPPSAERVYWTSFGCFIAGLAGMIAMLEPLSHRLYWLAAVVSVTAIVLGLYFRRFRSARLLADAWLAGVAGVSTFALVVLSVL
jgi:hypothetical protein